MPHKRNPLDDPCEWMRFAWADHAVAEALPRFDLWEIIATHRAQQAAEKELKAVLVAGSIRFPLMQDIGTLLEIIESHSDDLLRTLAAASILSSCATATRYPFEPERITDVEVSEAMVIARSVLRWCDQAIALTDDRHEPRAEEELP